MPIKTERERERERERDSRNSTAYKKLIQHDTWI